MVARISLYYKCNSRSYFARVMIKKNLKNSLQRVSMEFGDFCDSNCVRLAWMAMLVPFDYFWITVFRGCSFGTFLNNYRLMSISRGSRFNKVNPNNMENITSNKNRA